MEKKYDPRVLKAQEEMKNELIEEGFYTPHSWLHLPILDELLEEEMSKKDGKV